MLIAELPGIRIDGRPAVVAVMGSCRLYEPFLSCVGRDGSRLVVQAFTPFTYTAAEAWQYVEFCQGRRTIPAPYWPYVFSDQRVRAGTPGLPEALARADLCVAEISTADQLSAGGVYFNWNELGQRFVRQGGEPARRWWREVTDRGRRQASEETVERVLAARAAAGLETPPEIAALLHGVRFETLDQAELYQQLQRLSATCGRQWLFAAHLNIALTGPEVIAERQALLGALRQAAGALGHAVFDPTPAVVGHGYQRALRGNGTDKHHYAPDFRPVVGQALLDAIGQCLTGGGATARDASAVREAAKAAMARRDWAAAAAGWAQFRGLAPSDPAGFVSGSDALWQAGLRDAADTLAGAAVQLFPGNAWAAHHHAELAMRRQDWTLAQHRWLLVRDRFADDFAGYTNGAAALIKTGALAVAEGLLRWAAEHHPDRPEPWVGLGTLADRRGDWAAAAAAWQIVRDRFPDLPAGYGWGAEALFQTGQTGSAEAVAAAGVAKFPDSRWLAEVFAGLAARQRHWAAAISRWAAVRARFADQPVGWEMGAQCHWDAGEDAAAEALLGEAAARFPDHPRLSRRLAELSRHRAA